MDAIEAALKAGLDVRLICGYRWMVWYELQDEWTVYYLPSYAKKTRILIETADKEEALRYLTGEVETV